MDLDAIFQALTVADKKARDESPFNPFEDLAQGVGQRIFKDADQYSLGENLIGGLLTGIVGGGAHQLTDRYSADQNKLAQSVLFDSLTGNSQGRPTGMNPSIYSTLDNAGSIYALDRRLNQADDQRKSNLNTRSNLLSAMANANTPQQQRRIMELGKQMGLIDGNFATTVPEAQPMVKPHTAGMFPGGTLEDMRRSIITEALDQGLPGGAAQNEADSRTATFKKANAGALDKVSAARQQVTDLDRLIATADYGMKNAGETGGFFGGPRNLASKLAAALGSEEQTQKQAAQSLLDSVKPEIISSARPKGVGAMSDPEMNAYLGAGPSSIQTPEANKLLINKLKNIRDYQDEYASFLDTYMAEKGTVLPANGAPGAEALWEMYKQANPFTVDGGKLNEKRQSWQDFFTNGPRDSAAPAPQDSGTLPEGATATGKTSGGKPVYELNGKYFVVE